MSTSAAEQLIDNLESPIDTLVPSDIDDSGDNDISALDRGDVIEQDSPDVNDDDLEVITDKPTEAEEPAAEAEEPTEPEEPASETEEPEPKKPIMIPKGRLDQANARSRVLSQENEALKARIEELIKGTGQAAPAKPETPPEPEYDFAARQREEYEAILDGNVDRAAEIRQEMQAKYEEKLRREAAEAAQSTLTEAQERTMFNRAVEELTTRFPVFDPNGENFDENLTNEVVMLRGALESRGASPTAALVQATKYVLNTHRPDLLKKPEEETAPPPKPTSTTSSTQRKVLASQPAATTGEGNAERNTDAPINVARISEEEFDALPEATKRRLRGD